VISFLRTPAVSCFTRVNVRGQTLMSVACATAEPAADELAGLLKVRRWEPLHPRLLSTIFEVRGQSTAQKSQRIASAPLPYADISV
jgi:hypothetical protein